MWQAWQPTGEKYWEATYSQGKIVGQKIYWAGGKVIRKETYDQQGTMTNLETFHANGVKHSEGTFAKGKKSGTWTYWYPEGRVQAVGDWRQGKLWNGLCATPTAGDAGSWGGIETFKQYKDGSVVEAGVPAASR